MSEVRSRTTHPERGDHPVSRQNYHARTQTILRAAQLVICRRTPDRAGPRNLWSDAGDGAKERGLMSRLPSTRTRRALIARQASTAQGDGVHRSVKPKEHGRLLSAPTASRRAFEEVFVRVGLPRQGVRPSAGTRLLRAPRGQGTRPTTDLTCGSSPTRALHCQLSASASSTSPNGDRSPRIACIRAAARARSACPVVAALGSAQDRSGYADPVGDRDHRLHLTARSC
jgi:hypothetical protein